ncbi:MAG: NMD3-related protein [Candidatus Woesearchaeota archaeon]|jgi:nonsense-mediated mRNA decay protein 3|nr:NMD3-related protein [Candidatus Woesearchaeota archaeon]MDP7506551.1 NMD3-related protein [Candidatus Woesearchaeota archaeon]MDP7610636.1 NMD3-related protein [Candidatus Woesearchaeota archaeon]|tara:strand:- start:5100 stop:5537 length:438 start_codon:yes stop_codon:yes gene_type:complete
MPQNKNPQYFEGTLQLRNHNDEVISFIANQMKKRDDAFIAKQVKAKNGVDLYFSSNKFLKALGKKLQNHFGGELKTSATLHTRSRQSSKNLYRLTVFFKLSEFKVGDIIKFKGDKLKILKAGKKVLCKNIDTGKKLTLNYKDLKN